MSLPPMPYILALHDGGVDGLPPLPDRAYVGIEPFRSRVFARLDQFRGQLLTGHTAAMAAETAKLEFRSAEARGDRLIFADGAVLTGLDVRGDGDSLSISWRTAFWPRPRYVDEPNSLALGFFEQFDLYVVEQDPLPPTIVARYGRRPEQYMTANPSLMTREQVIASGPQFAEALRRLDILHEWP